MISLSLRSNLLRLLFLIVLITCSEAATEKVLHEFDPAPGGASPLAGLIADAAGNLYGTASYGHNLGVVFELSPGKNGGWTETILYSFQGNPYGAYQLGPVDGAYPEGSLVFDSAGNLYGTTSAGGFYNSGTVFELSLSTSGWKETVLYYFGIDGFYAPTGGLTIDHAGNLYGSVSSGNPDDYDGCYWHNHASFPGCGAIFELSPNGDGTWTESNIYIFQGTPDGSTPRSTLVFDAKGNLYGTTEYGGSSSGLCSGDYLWGCGTVFELTPNGGGTWSENILYYFSGQGDGANPIGRLVFDQRGNLYGTTYGVYAGVGSVFKLSHGSWNETTLHRFDSKEEGRHPYGGVVIDSAGDLYGATEYGGSGSCPGLCGTVYELTSDQDTWSEKVIYKFAGEQDGSHPAGDLLSDSSGNLYMTASSGGHKGCDRGCGSVFELIPSSKGNWRGSAVYDLPFHDDGGFSYAGLISDSSGNLYGTTEYGGDLTCNYPLGCGTVFELTPSSSGKLVVRVLHQFNSASGDGAFPVAGLVSDSAGNLYGTTQYGGLTGCGSSTGQCGTVFELSQSSNGSWDERVIHRFEGSPDGFGPLAGLIRDQAGNLYGTTGSGGTGCNGGCGTVFKMSPTSHGGWKEEILYTFGSQQGDGLIPTAGLVFDNKGVLYGTTSAGGLEYFSDGTVFQLNPHSDGSWTEKVIYSFTGGYDGAYPLSGLTIDQEGALYGTTYEGGEYEGGVVFKLSAGTGGSWNEGAIHQFIGVNGDGAYPEAGVVFDKAGNLYGTTTIGGTNGGGCGYGNGCGTVFALAPNNGAWDEKILYRFTGGRDGGGPYAGLILDAAGNLYGTASSGGAGAGVVFEVMP
jgi:uncharacterized repeat protein (TIGR03803 family)